MELIQVQPCPQQMNAVDCGLFAVAISVHILEGVQIQKDAFNQTHITKFQQMLLSLLNQKKKEVSQCDALAISPAFRSC